MPELYFDKRCNAIREDDGEVRLHEPSLLQPLRWKRPRRIFWNAHGDLFHPAVPDDWIDRVFAVCALTPQHTHMILTKRSARMREYMGKRDTSKAGDPITTAAFFMNRSVRGYAGQGGSAQWPLPNVWLGVSVEDQTRADERIPDLLATPAAVRFLSCEPLLGLVDLSAVPWHVAGYRMEGALPDPSEHDDFRFWHHEAQGIRWVIVGGESGPGARPMHQDWARSLRDQCAAAGVPFHFKQWGEYATVFDRDVDDPDWRDCGRWVRERPKGRWLNLAGGTGFHGERVCYVDPVGKMTAGRLLDGVEHNGFPEVRHG